MGLIITLGILLSILIAGYYGYYTEKRAWNNGVAPSGEPWKRIIWDMNGTRGYSDTQGNFIWISYFYIDRDYKENF